MLILFHVSYDLDKKKDLVNRLFKLNSKSKLVTLAKKYETITLICSFLLSAEGKVCFETGCIEDSEWNITKVASFPQELKQEIPTD